MCPVFRLMMLFMAPSTVFTKNNGKFLGLVKISSKFHKMPNVIRTNNNETNDYYLG